MSIYLSQLDCFYNIESVTCQGCKMVFNTEETTTDDWFFAWDGDTTEDCCSDCYSKYAIKKGE